MIQPALTQLHPEKPPRPIIAGETWTKRASQKCSNNRPMIVVDWLSDDKRVGYRIDGQKWTQTERTLRRDWE